MPGEFDRFRPNPYNLVEELTEQPRSYREAADLLIQARRDVKRAEDALEGLEAEIALDIKKNPEEYNLSKSPTVPDIKNLVIVDRRRKDLLKILRKAEYNRDILEANVKSWEGRKYSIQDLVKLRLADYYADPRVDEETRKMAEEQEIKKVFKPKRRD